MMRALNELHAAAMRGKAHEVAGPLLRQIVSLTNEHFSAEERLMQSTGYPGLAAHRDQHRELSGKIAEFVSRHKNGDAAVYTPLLYFVRDYQTKHMQCEDQEYAPWLMAHGVK
jgi:hemerythrin-like metal-binding protein